jgi:hypothetical protein
VPVGAYLGATRFMPSGVVRGRPWFSTAGAFSAFRYVGFLKVECLVKPMYKSSCDLELALKYFERAEQADNPRLKAKLRKLAGGYRDNALEILDRAVSSSDRLR